MGHCADELAILNDRAAGHVCVKYRTKVFYKFLRFLAFGVENQRIINMVPIGEYLWIAKPTCMLEELHYFFAIFHYINIDLPSSSAERKKTEAV